MGGKDTPQNIQGTLSEVLSPGILGWPCILEEKQGELGNNEKRTNKSIHVILWSSIEVATGPNSTLIQENMAFWFHA